MISFKIRQRKYCIVVSAFDNVQMQMHCCSSKVYIMYDMCDPSARNQSHVGRVRFPLRAEMHGRAHITDSCFIAFITSKIC